MVREKLKALLIDDDEAFRVLFKKYIQMTGHPIELIEAVKAEEAIQLVRSSDDIDCIFLDYMLPDMDGVCVLRSLYNEESDLGPCPIVVLTGQGSEAVALEAIEFGAQDYLVKDNMTSETLYLALAKARKAYDLKKTRNEALAMLEHSQKMEAVGNLTGGIAHDFNNLLTIVFGNIRLLELLMGDEKIDRDQVCQKIGTVKKATERGAELVKRLMLLSRQRKLSPITTDLNHLIRDLEELLTRSLGEFVSIKTDLANDLQLVDVDPGQFEHALINMGINARDAMPDGGDFILKTENVILDEKSAKCLRIPSGPYAILSVSDTGHGIPEDVKAKIFNPFFTTKEIGKGTGLGLSMVYSFVKESGCAIDFDSKEGEGTQFFIYFPYAKSQEIEVKAEEEEDAYCAESGNETVLVVEDEEDIRVLAVNILKENGYTVLEAENGMEGLSILQRTPHQVDLIFTDIAMPGDMNGVQMAARAQVIMPNVKLLFTSGYASAAVPDMDLAQRYPLLNKPYKPRHLLDRIQEVLRDT